MSGGFSQQGCSGQQGPVPRGHPQQLYTPLSLPPTPGGPAELWEPSPVRAALCGPPHAECALLARMASGPREHLGVSRAVAGTLEGMAVAWAWSQGAESDHGQGQCFRISLTTGLKLRPRVWEPETHPQAAGCRPQAGRPWLQECQVAPGRSRGPPPCPGSSPRVCGAWPGPR